MIEVTETLTTPEMHNCCELGATLFVAGLRIFIPEWATDVDIEHAMESLQRFAACRDKKSHTTILESVK